MKPHSHNLIWASVLTLHLSKELLSHEMTICWWRQKLLSWYVMPYKLKKNISSHEQESAVTPSARLFFFSSFLKQKPQRRDAKKNVHQIQLLQCKHLSNIMTKCNTVEGFVLWLFTLRPHAKQFNSMSGPNCRLYKLRMTYWKKIWVSSSESGSHLNHQRQYVFTNF